MRHCCITALGFLQVLQTPSLQSWNQHITRCASLGLEELYAETRLNFQLNSTKALVPDPQTKLPQLRSPSYNHSTNLGGSWMKRPGSTSVQPLFKSTWQWNDFHLSGVDKRLGPMKPNGLSVAGLDSRCRNPRQRRPQQGRRTEEAKESIKQAPGSFTSKASASS